MITGVIFSGGFKLAYWVVAFLVSVIYSFGAFEIHNDTSGDSLNLLGRLHQYWFNCLGALAGFILLWIVLPDLWLAIQWQLSDPIPLEQVLIFLLALIGITGHFPKSLYAIAGFIQRLYK